MNDKALLLTLMREGATVITPNKRLSNELLNDFFKATPAPVKDKPSCLPYQAFLQASFKKFCLKNTQIRHPFILTAQQLCHLWRQIIATSINAPINEGLVNAINEAWTRCNLWLIDFNHPAFSSTPQTYLFQQWAFQLQQALVKLGALTEDQVASYLYSQENFFSATTLIWACFDDYTPQQRELQKHLTIQGCKLIHYDLDKQSASLYQYAAKDVNDEYQQMIHWLKDCLAKGETRIAVVVPDLQAQSQSLQRLLQQHIPCEQFNISLGKPLADYSLVAHALNWLSLDGNTLSIHQARLLLHSPYLAYSQTEMLARAQLMEESLILQEQHFEQSLFLKELNFKTPKLAELLKKMTKYPEQSSTQAWINAFKTRLMSLGFPGEYPLDSATYQGYQRFLSLFDELQQLALITPHMSQEQAITTLKNLAKATIFQPKKLSTPIQILGLLEASGCTFESMWVTGLTDQCLPRQARLSAFIPISLQCENLMPYANPARELQLAQKTMMRLKNSSTHCVFSYPRLSSDKPNMPSPFIVDLTQFPAYLIETIAIKSSLESFAENYLLPLTQEERTSGGTAILSNQAKCPFRAFATHRLHARASLETSEGPDAKERGQLIHKVMELLWVTLQNQQNLLAIDAKQLDQHIELAILTALEPLINQRSYSFSTLFQEVELERLKRLVHACLEWERQRPSFEIDALEQAYTIHLADMEFHVRVDRLDRTEQGKKWVIDYKSSLPQSLPWNEERPREPQLLLYALLDETINTLLFAQLKTGQLTYKGLSEEAHPLTGITTLKKDQNWAEHRKLWQAQLNALASEFSQGYCPPQPINSSVCQQCEFQNLCRFTINS